MLFYVIDFYFNGNTLCNFYKVSAGIRSGQHVLRKSVWQKESMIYDIQKDRLPYISSSLNRYRQKRNPLGIEGFRYKGENQDIIYLGL